MLKFSLGFGSPIGFGRFRLRWLRGGTEYVIAWFPLGGFVKMLGEMQPGGEVAEGTVIDARPDEYLGAKNTWQKLSISFAGPAMNLLLPVLAFAVVLWVGVPRATSVLGTVERGSPAAEAGLEPGDRILAVDGQEVVWWQETSQAIAEAAGSTVRLVVERDAESLQFDVPIERRGSLDVFGGVEDVGWIGLRSARLPALLGVPSNDAPASVAGLRSGDRVVKVGSVEVEDWDELRAAYAAAGAASRFGRVDFEVMRDPGDGAEAIARRISVPLRSDLGDLGVISAAILVSVVSAGMPAEEAGLERGDLLLALDGQPIGSFESFRNSVRTSGGRSLEVVYARDGETRSASIRPRLQPVSGPLAIEGMTEDIYLIGIQHALAALPGDSALDRARNPFVALPRAFGMTVDMTVMFLRGIGKLISGEVGSDKLAGPIGIAEIARKSLDLGWQTYLSTMILISINLGIVNLLPIPILDGGQMIIYLVEGVRRAPISLRSREIVQQAGLLMIVMVMALAFWNDLSRHWAKFVEWLGTAL
ncbi:MAG: RIP metalloprotease RseP [Myxococcota bacterium]|nr:RIP metalloprotease RseP [Myxococcota bacterium]